MSKKIPERQCIACREMKAKKDMIRVVKSKEGEISLDLTGKANGRGAYLCNSLDCLQKAMKTSAIERSLKTSIDKSIYEEMERQMTENE